MEVSELAVAQALEFEILQGHGLNTNCTCAHKYPMCPFPNSSWVYAPACIHDEYRAEELGLRTSPVLMDYEWWWFDLTSKNMISRLSFDLAYTIALLGSDEQWVRTHANTSLFYIREDGRVLKIISGKIGGGGMVNEWK